LDNVTHSLFGMLVADAVCVWRRETRAEVRAAASLLSALANNLPDIDIVYSWIDGPKPLGSLLQHRGHTHTLLLALPMAWLLGVGMWRWLARSRPAAFTPDRKQWLLLLALAGPALHLLMDYGNNYGVHPFWPVYSGWLYGDSIFIVEPLWLVILVPAVARGLTRRWLAALLWLVLASVLTICWFVPFVPTASRLALLGLALATFTVGRLTSESTRVALALGGCLSVALLFVAAGARARSELRAAVQTAFPALTVHDIATAPMPANPACWEALLAGEQGGRYRVLRASVALGPLSATDCSAGSDVEPTAPIAKLSRAHFDGVRWRAEYSADLAELSRLRRADCRFRAMLRFARLPYFAPAHQIAGDLRYDRQPGLDFSDVALSGPASTAPCPRFVPGWTEPRADLFRP
jgi:inner membrane protein